MYGRDLRHSFTNAASAINPGNVALLQPAWTFPVGDAVSASPAVVEGVVYVGSWDGYFYAIDAATGTERWRFEIDCQNSIIPIPPRCLAPGESPPDRTTTDGGLITSSAAVVDLEFVDPHGIPRKEKRVFFAGGKTLYSLRAADGSLVWKKVICGNPDAPDCENDADDPSRIFSSPALHKAKVFVGHTIDGIAVEGKSYRGGFEALHANTGEVVWRFETDPLLENGQPVVENGKVVPQNRSCGGVWSSAAVDQASGLVFFNTADCDFDAPPPYHEAVIALDASNGKLRWVFRPRDTDTCDFDFGASPNVIDLAGERFLGNAGKDGTYYLLNRLTGEQVWATRVVFGGFSGGFIGSTAFDGSRIFGGTAFGELGNPSGVCDPFDPRDTVIQEPSMHAFTAADGTIAWQRTASHSLGASSVANGVVFTGGVLPPALRAVDSQSGDLLAEFPMVGAVNSSAALVGDMLFVGSGNSNDGGGSAVHAFRLVVSPF